MNTENKKRGVNAKQAKENLIYILKIMGLITGICVSITIIYTFISQSKTIAAIFRLPETEIKVSQALKNDSISKIERDTIQSRATAGDTKIINILNKLTIGQSILIGNLNEVKKTLKLQPIILPDVLTNESGRSHIEKIDMLK